MIPYSRQKILNEDIQEVNKVLKSDYLTQGPFVDRFENSIIKYTGAKFATAVNSATSALHLSCLALGLKKGDILWTVPNTFVASANCAIHCGAKVDFVDIDENDFNISIKKLKEKLEKTKPNKIPKILITVHFGGLPTYQDKIYKLSKKYNFKIIEDASHSIGSKYKNEIVGSCRWSNITVFSFHPVKIITSGEGGVATTNSLKINQKLKLLRTHGIFKSKKFKPWYYEQKSLGFNYRMSDIHAALGYSQIKKINKFVNERNKIANLYKEYLANTKISFQQVNKYSKSSYHLFVIKIDFQNDKKKYENLFKLLRKKNFFVNLHYLPVHLHPYYKELGFKKNNFPVAENYSKKAISLPIFYGLQKKTQIKIIKLIFKFLKNDKK